MKEGKIKVLFPENVETITISKNDYDRLYGEMTYKNIELQEKIDTANRLLENILVVRDWKHEGKFRPVKNTTSQDVYKTIVMLNEILETPRRINYGLLQGIDESR